MDSLGTADWALLALGLAAAGVFAGLLAGLLGVGGGIVMVPALYHIFGVLGIRQDLIMLVAVGTSLAAMIPTSIRSVRAHHAMGAVDAQMLRTWAPVGLLGSCAGAAIAGIVGGRGLAMVFAVVATLAALNMMIGNDRWRIAQRLPGSAGQRFMAFVIAVVSVMMGIGGGTLSVPILSLFGYPIHRAVGTAAGFGLVIARTRRDRIPGAGLDGGRTAAIDPGLHQPARRGPAGADEHAQRALGRAAGSPPQSRLAVTRLCLFLLATSARMILSIGR